MPDGNTPENDNKKGTATNLRMTVKRNGNTPENDNKKNNVTPEAALAAE